MTATRRTTAAHRAASVVVGMLLALPLAGVVVVSTAAPAQASTYRYWTYWWGTDTGKPHTGWKFAPQGPAFHGLGDQWVLGWRFSTTTTVGGAQPRQSPSYAALCPGTSPVAGSVRIALVLDYGTASDAPPGQKPPTSASVRLECLVIPMSPAPTGLTVLRAAKGGVSVRDENGLICALDGYPVGECAPVIPDPIPSATHTPRTTVSPTHVASSTPTSTNASTSAATIGATSPTSSTAPSSTPSAQPDESGSAAAATPETDGSPSETVLPGIVGAPQSATVEQPAGSPLGLGVGALVIAAVAGSAYWTSRRGGRAS